MDERIKQLVLRFYVKDGTAYVRAIIVTEVGEVVCCDTEMDTTEIVVELEERPANQVAVNQEGAMKHDTIDNIGAAITVSVAVLIAVSIGYFGCRYITYLMVSQ